MTPLVLFWLLFGPVPPPIAPPAEHITELPRKVTLPDAAADSLIAVLVTTEGELPADIPEECLPALGRLWRAADLWVGHPSNLTSDIAWTRQALQEVARLPPLAECALLPDYPQACMQLEAAEVFGKWVDAAEQVSPWQAKEIRAECYRLKAIWVAIRNAQNPQANGVCRRRALAEVRGLLGDAYFSGEVPAAYPWQVLPRR